MHCLRRGVHRRGRLCGGGAGSPTPGLGVQYDPEEIWISVLIRRRGGPRRGGVGSETAAAIGITNQRETTVARSGSARTAQRSVAPRHRLAGPAGLPGAARSSRGTSSGSAPDSSRIPISPATKLEWLLNETGGNLVYLAFGTVDSWLLWQLTGGAVHATDVSNASRTMSASRASSGTTSCSSSSVCRARSCRRSST